MYEDTTDNINFLQILSPEYQQKFSPGKKDVYNFGFIHSSLWCKFTVRMDSLSEWYLDVDNPSLEYVTFYYPTNQNTYDSLVSGIHTPFDSSGHARNKNMFVLSGHNGSEKTYYLKLSSRRPMQFPLRISSKKIFVTKSYHTDLLHGFYWGFMVLMALYNLFIWFSDRDKSFFYYVCYVICIAAFNGMITGSMDFFLPDYVWLFKYGDVITAMTGIFALLFCIHFLHTSERSPKLHRVLRAFIPVYMVVACLPFFGLLSETAMILGIVSMVASIIVLLSAFAVFSGGFKPAIYFIIGWSALILCIMIFILKDFGILSYTTFTANATLFGSAFEALLFSFALASKINSYKREKEIAHAQMLKNALDNEKFVNRQNIILEQKVVERTSELNKTNNELTATLGNLRATQDQLVQSEKMASLGQLTAGIAHEIQNPLNFVNNFSELSVDLLQELEDIPDAAQKKIIVGDLKQNLIKIVHHGKRAESIVKGMLMHSRSDTVEKQPRDINTLVEEFLALAYHGIRAKDTAFNCEIEKSLTPNLPSVNIIPQNIGRVLLNIFNNAFYAVDEKKKSSANEYRPTVSIKTKKENNRIVISIRDNGKGISSETKDKIFEPFFTTKPTGQGTGLGLSISYDIIAKGHLGELKVDSQSGEFTEFIISLPVN